MRLVGKDSLSEDQKCTLEVAKIIREAARLQKCDRALPIQSSPKCNPIPEGERERERELDRYNMVQLD